MVQRPDGALAARRSKLDEAAYKVALLCSGIGDIRRGSETFFSEYFAAVNRAEIEKPVMHLYQGGTEYRVPNARRLWRLGRNSKVARLLGRARIRHGSGWARGFWTENVTYMLSFLLTSPFRSAYDVLHVTDSQTKNMLCFLKRKGLIRAKIVFSIGVAYELLRPGLCDSRRVTDVDLFHFSNQADYELAMSDGLIPADRATCLPQGVNAAFFSAADQARGLAARDAFGIPRHSRLLISVGALGEGKNMRLLVDAVRQLPEDVSLLVLGDHASPSLLKNAKESMGQRFAFGRLPQRELADVMCTAELDVFPSLSEGFGRSVLEAVCAGVPCLVHDNDWFKVLIQCDAFRVDMRDPANLSNRIEALLDNPNETHERFLHLRHQIMRQYDWSNLLPRYLAELYCKPLGLTDHDSSSRTAGCVL